MSRVENKSTSHFYDAIATGLDHVLGKAAGRKVGFCLLVFPFAGDGDTEGQGADYVTNGCRADMIKYLRETADRLEERSEFPPTIGEA